MTLKSERRGKAVLNPEKAKVHRSPILDPSQQASRDEFLEELRAKSVRPIAIFLGAGASKVSAIRLRGI